MEFSVVKDVLQKIIMLSIIDKSSITTAALTEQSSVFTATAASFTTTGLHVTANTMCFNAPANPLQTSTAWQGYIASYALVYT